MLSAATYFPNALIGPPPVIAQPVDQVTQMHPEVVRDGIAVLVGQIHGIHELAVDVQLQLVIRAVTDADRTRTFVTL